MRRAQLQPARSAVRRKGERREEKTAAGNLSGGGGGEARRLTGDHGVLQIVLGRAGLPDLREVFELTAAQLELAAQVRLLQDPLEAPGELLLYVAAHVRRNHRHITFFGHGVHAARFPTARGDRETRRRRPPRRSSRARRALRSALVLRERAVERKGGNTARTRTNHSRECQCRY